MHVTTRFGVARRRASGTVLLDGLTLLLNRCKMALDLLPMMARDVARKVLLRVEDIAMVLKSNSM